MKTYPTTTSRTLDPNGKALVTIVGLHDHLITDADINLIQDLQDQKRQSLLGFATSGGLTYTPMVFNPFTPNTFFIPAFDVLFNGEVIHIAGNRSSDQATNRVQVPAPAHWSAGELEEEARAYVVFLEVWYQALDVTTVPAKGYYTDPNTGLIYFFPFGGVNPDPTNAVAPSVSNDTIDPFQGLLTTQRAQIQWRIGVQRVSLGYDFNQHPFGLELDSAADTTFGQPQAIQAQAGQPAPIPTSTYQFANLGTITGDSGVWRAGDGNPNNSVGTMDGYSYALPLALVFQRNTGPFSLKDNIFGCADPAVPGSGLLASRTSGRFDSKLADQVFPGDVVDTRSTVKLDGWEVDQIMREGFADLVMGNTRMATGRGESPGNKAIALGSTLSYDVSMSPTPVDNTKTIGKFLPLTVGNTEVNAGFANGFSSDKRVFFTVALITIAQKSVGTPGVPWAKNDAVSISIPSNAGATLSSVTVTALVSNSDGSKTPAALLQGQVEINVGATAATIIFTNDLRNTGFDPGSNPLSLVIGAEFSPGSGVDLRKIPVAVNGGYVQDAVSGRKLPIFGISEYAVQADRQTLGTGVSRVVSINPNYSDIVFGTKIWIQIPGTDSRLVRHTVAGNPVTTFTLDRQNLNGTLKGLYVTRAWDFDTGNFYSISSRTMNGNNTILDIQGTVPTTSTLVVSVLAQDTCQASYNAPVKAITAVEETVLMGNYTTDNLFPMDPRISVVSVGYDATTTNSIVDLAADGGYMDSAAGDDVVKLVWVFSGGILTAYPVSRMNIAKGIATAVVPGIDLRALKFFFVGAFHPAFSKNSQLVISIEYLPYQGEGRLQRNYEFLHAEDDALVTTNGTGAAPVAGLADVFPYNRELPIATSMPAQLGWEDSGLINEPVASFFDNNFTAMRVNNVEHTFLVPLHTLDFIPPVNRDIRKVIQFVTAGLRGFSKVTPHIGFGIGALTPRTVLGQNLQATTSPIQLYVNNTTGNDASSGLSILTAKKTIGAALAELPPVLRHPCVVILVATGLPYNISTLAPTLDVIALGDGDLRSAKQYALGNLSRVIHDSGRLVISRQTGATDVVSIDATGFPGFGDGPTSAFYIDTSRVILNGLKFIGFTNPAITAYNSDIDFVDCEWEGNVQAGAYVGCDVVVLDRGKTKLPDSGEGHVCTQSNLTSSAHKLEIASGAVNTGAFYIGTRNSTLNLRNHGTGSLEETNIVATTVVADAELNSSISVTGDFTSQGTAILKANSALSRTVVVDPFPAGVTKDSSSNIVTELG